jgi:hypothetical protein
VSDAYEARFTGPERWLRIVRVTDGQTICTRGTEAWDNAIRELNALADRVAQLEAENTAIRAENQLVRIAVDAIGAGAVWQLANDPRTARVAELEAENTRWRNASRVVRESLVWMEPRDVYDESCFKAIAQAHDAVAEVEGFRVRMWRDVWPPTEAYCKMSLPRTWPLAPNGPDTAREAALEADNKRLREALEFVSVEADREANSARAEVDGEHTTWQELSFRTLATFARAALESEREESVT